MVLIFLPFWLLWQLGRFLRWLYTPGRAERAWAEGVHAWATRRWSGGQDTRRPPRRIEEDALRRHFPSQGRWSPD